MARGGQILRSGRYHLDAAGRLHRWLPQPTVAPVALVTVRARRMRVFAAPVIAGLPPVELVAPMLDAFEDPAPVATPPVPLPPVAAMAAASQFVMEAPTAGRPPKISLKNAPSSMELQAAQWRGPQ